MRRPSWTSLSKNPGASTIRHGQPGEAPRAPERMPAATWATKRSLARDAASLAPALLLTGRLTVAAAKDPNRFAAGVCLVRHAGSLSCSLGCAGSSVIRNNIEAFQSGPRGLCISRDARSLRGGVGWGLKAVP